jgi:hypothetical protein
MRIARREVEGLLDSAEHFAGLYRAYHIQAARTIRQFAEVCGMQRGASVADLHRVVVGVWQVYPSARASDTSVSQLLGDDFSDAATTVHSTSTGVCRSVIRCSSRIALTCACVGDQARPESCSARHSVTGFESASRSACSTRKHFARLWACVLPSCKSGLRPARRRHISTTFL